MWWQVHAGVHLLAELAVAIQCQHAGGRQACRAVGTGVTAQAGWLAAGGGGMAAALWHAGIHAAGSYTYCCCLTGTLHAGLGVQYGS